MKSEQLTKAIVLMLFFGVFDLQASTLEETFEEYAIEKSLHNQGGWLERAYGKHPAFKVVYDSDRASKVIQPFGGGDRHMYKVFPKSKFNELLKGNIISLDLSFKKGTTIILGIASKHTSGKELKLQCRDKVALSFNNKYKHVGLLNLNAKKWIDVRLLIEKRGKQALVSVASRDIKKGVFLIDPALHQIKIPLDELAINTWTGISLRLDGSDRLDNIKLSAYDKFEAIPDKIKLGKVKVSFQPILDHLEGPRRAIDLSGKWEFLISKNENMPKKDSQWGKVVVPDNHARLIGSAGKGCVYFRKRINTTELKLREHTQVFISFERVTDICDVYVNNKLIGRNTDGFFPFKFNITDAIEKGENTILVKVLGPKATLAQYTRPQGWTWYLPTFAGIPYPVHLEMTNAIIVTDTYVKTSVGKTNTLEAIIKLTNFSKIEKEIQIEASVKDTFKMEEVEITLAPGQTQEVTLKNNWHNPRLWWPHDPHLNYLTIKVTENNKVVDRYKQRFGFREIKVVGKDMFLNNKNLTHRRNSIIPYYTDSTDEDILKKYRLLKSRGYNGSRLHGGSLLRFIRVADEFGWLLSPESAINEPRGHQVKESYWPAAKQHLHNMVTKLRNHPSIIYWCISNEFGSYYMKGTKKEKEVVDTWLLERGKEVALIDPTRTWTASGDGELGGWGNHGDAPTLSFHYAWQPFKQHNVIPNTVYWLEEGKKPWQGIGWDQKKPIMLSEDLYSPYAFKPPHGMASWGGDKTYDINGLSKTYFDAYRMFCDGYYHASVTTWNPWGTAEGGENNAIYNHGQLMPDFHIAIKEMNRTFYSEEKVSRKIWVYNKLFEDKKCELTVELVRNGASFYSFKKSFTLIGGGRKAFDISLPAIRASVKQKYAFILTLKSNAQTLAEKKLTYTYYPKTYEYKFPENTAWVSPEGKLPSGVSGDFSVYNSVGAALKANPQYLIIAKIKGITPDEGALLSEKVTKGLSVLWIEMSTEGWKKGKINEREMSGFSFVRAKNSASLKNIQNTDLALWRPDGYASRQSFTKPTSGNYDVLTDSSGGLGSAPLMRLYTGSGSWLLCQYPLISKWDIEPATRFLFNEFLAALDKPLNSATRTLAVYHDTSSSELEKSLATLKIPFVRSKLAKVLIFNGAEKLSKSALSSIYKSCSIGGVSIINDLSSENAAALSALTKIKISLKKTKAFQLIKNTPSGIMSGFSNSDLYWPLKADELYKQFSAKLRGKAYVAKAPYMISREIIVPGKYGGLVSPSGIVEIPFKKGKIVISTVRWQKFLTIKPVRAKRYIATILNNLDVNLGEKELGQFQVSIKEYANRGFWNQAGSQYPAWFNKGNDDMRYFPVNRTGMDPELNVPLPPQSYPAGTAVYAGINFKLIDSQKNKGASCIVVGPKKEIEIPINHKLYHLWHLGALSEIQKTGTSVARVSFIYADGSARNVFIFAGVQLNGYQYPTDTKEGTIAWVGRTPKWHDAVLWAWSVKNPFPEKTVQSVKISVLGKASLAIISLTGEHQL